MKVTGMILAAGFGTRLQPLTDRLPKALIPFMGKPMIDYVINKMKDFGIERIVVNVHHHRKKMIEYLTDKDFGVEILISDEKEEHLLTGGGIKNAARYFQNCDNILVHNADIISSVDYAEFLAFHEDSQARITLAVRSKDDPRVFCFNERMELTGWMNKKTGEVRKSKVNDSSKEYGFNGIYLLSSHAIKEFPEKNKFSVVDFFLEYTKTNPVLGFVDDSRYWFDLGSVEKIKKAENYFLTEGKYFE